MSHEESVREHLKNERALAKAMCQKLGEEVKTLFENMELSARNMMPDSTFAKIKEDYDGQMSIYKIVMENAEETVEEIKRTTTCLQIFKNHLEVLRSFYISM